MTHQNQEGVLSQEPTKQEILSPDKCVINIPDSLLSGFVHCAHHNQYHGGTSFHNTATGLIGPDKQKNQVSLGTDEALTVKKKFNNGCKSWLLLNSATLMVKMESSILNLFVKNCKIKNQNQSFYGIDVHQQNVLAEISIQNIIYDAWASISWFVTLEWVGSIF